MTTTIKPADPDSAEPAAWRRSLRIGGMSWVLRLRALAVPVIGLALTLFMLALSLTLGDFPIALGDVVNVLIGQGQQAHEFIVTGLRLPRALTGALVGAALGLAGAITQSIARNPLASPDILGVTAGAAAGAVTVIMIGGSAGGISGYLAEAGLPIAALIGALVAATAVYLLAWRRGIEGFRLVLVGLGVHAVLMNVTFWLLTLSDVADAGRAMVWITGSLNGRGWEHVWPVAIALVVLLPLALYGAHVLGALQYGDDTVRSLGVRMELSRSLLILIAVGLAAVAAAGAGPVEFVALAVPQIALRACGVARPPLIASAVLGALMVVSADVLARTAFGSVELPVGIVTALLGAPYLMYLIVRRYRGVRG